MSFFGRTFELSLLDEYYDDGNANLAMVYGRRRVGKSELILQSLKRRSVPFIYMECKATSEDENVQRLMEMIPERLGFTPAKCESFEQVLVMLFELFKDRPMILVLDEYPYLRETKKGFDSIIQSLLDRYKKTSRMKLVICGSYLEIMRGMLEYKSPLYGRAGMVIDLKPLDYYDCQGFYDGFSKEDRVHLYAVFGGIPYYNTLLNSDRTVKENIIKLLVRRDARLEAEVELFINTETSKISDANQVIMAMAAGQRKFSDILGQTDFKNSSKLADILSKLRGIGLVEKTAPINEPDNPRRTSWRICDNLTNFYYRYIYRRASQRLLMNPEEYFRIYISEDFEAKYVPSQFEGICTEFLIRRNLMGLNDRTFFNIGRYYYDDPVKKKNGEFDIVTEDEVGYVFYEAKFRAKPLSPQTIQKELDQVEESPLKPYRCGFISRSGYDGVAPSEGLMLFTLDDLYAPELSDRLNNEG